MDQVETPKKKKFNLSTYAVVVAFLCLEVLALVSFNLANNYILFGSLSIALAILLFLVTFRQIKKDGFATFAYFLFPIFIYGLLSALSPFVKESDGAIGIANGIFIPITLTFMALCGFFASHIKTFDLQKVFLVIYGALAVFVLINFIATMVYYVPFYTIIYKNSYIFFEGKPSVVPIGKTAYMLFGFEIIEVSTVYWSLYPSILLSSCVGLFFIKFKENKKLFLAYLAFTILGGICLLFTISKDTLFGDLMVIFVLIFLVLAIKDKNSHKAIKYILLVILGLFILGCLALFLNAQSNWSWLHPLQNFIKKDELLNRLFNSNRYSARFYVILWEMFNPGKIFGSFVGIVSNEGLGLEQQLSVSWAFDNLLTSGLFGSLFFAFALFIGIRRLIKYYQNSGELPVNKWLLIAYIAMTFGVCFIAYDGTPLINADNLFPFYMFTPLLISIFLFGYTFKPLEEKEIQPVQEEAISDEENINI